MTTENWKSVESFSKKATVRKNKNNNPCHFPESDSPIIIFLSFLAKVVVNLVSYDDGKLEKCRVILQENWMVGRKTQNFHSTPMKSTQLGINVLARTELEHYLQIEVN